MRSRLSALAGLGVCLLALSGPSTAVAAPGEITLKKSFWSGWKYSLDGETYEKVGITGTSLRSEMAGNAAAQEEMMSYRSRKLWAAITDGAGSALMGWAIIDWALDDDDGWNDSNSILLGVGLGLSVAGGVMNATATSHLQQAVRLHNGQSSVWSLGLDGHAWALPEASPVTASLCVAF